MTGTDAGGLGLVFNEVPELYDRTRPAYPDALFADLAEVTGLGRPASRLNQAARSGSDARAEAAAGRDDP